MCDVTNSNKGPPLQWIIAGYHNILLDNIITLSAMEMLQKTICEVISYNFLKPIDRGETNLQ